MYDQLRFIKCLSFLFLLILPSSLSAVILGVFPIFSRSHFNVFEPLLLKLVTRGHSLVLISAYPLSTAAEDYIHIDIQEAKEKFNGTWSLDTFPQIPVTFNNVLSIMRVQVKENENIFKLQSIQDLINSEITFDLVIVEQFTSDVFFGFAHRFKAPLVAFSSCPPMPWAMDRYGVPASLSSSPNLFSDYSSAMSFSQRILNVIQVVYAKVYQRLIFNSITENMAKTYFGHNTPSVEEIIKNASLFLVNSHFTFYSPTPFPPQAVEVGGIHVKAPKPLFKDLDLWMNESAAGVVYFSFGSMLRAATLPSEKVKAFLQVFRTLPLRVLWKWEEDIVEGLPANVKIMKWLPQRDILAHPKVRVFISHGGLLGTTEAVVSGVPILGIPMYGDQPNNVAALVEKGVAVHVDYNNISVASISYALNTLLTDNSYSENAKLLSQRFLDRPLSPLDTAVYWTEYVIRHRGAPHLQSAAVHLTWYQYYLLDIFAVILVILCLMFLVFYCLVKRCIRFLFSTKPIKLKTT